MLPTVVILYNKQECQWGCELIMDLTQLIESYKSANAKGHATNLERRLWFICLHEQKSYSDSTFESPDEVNYQTIYRK